MPIVDGGPPLPFDMDFSAFSAAPKVDDKTAAALPESALQDTDTEQAATVARDAADLMQRIETDRVPCPRLCGATFGPGIGGLVSFNNGEIRRMWNWWERTDPSRSAASTAPGIIGELLLADGLDSGSTYVKRDCPRTLKDLTDMTAAAKASQWGDRDESEASSAGFHAPGPSFFEDASDGSTESGEDDLDDKDDMYDSYFGDSQRPVLEGSTLSREAPENQTPGKKASEQFGPSSDSLAPIVNLTRRFEKLALSSQRIELAKGWQLGLIAERVAVRNEIQPKTRSASMRNENEAKPPTWSRQTASAGTYRISEGAWVLNAVRPEVSLTLLQ